MTIIRVLNAGQDQIARTVPLHLRASSLESDHGSIPSAPVDGGTRTSGLFPILPPRVFEPLLTADCGELRGSLLGSITRITVYIVMAHYYPVVGIEVYYVTTSPFSSAAKMNVV